MRRRNFELALARQNRNTVCFVLTGQLDGLIDRIMLMTTTFHLAELLAFE